MNYYTTLETSKQLKDWGCEIDCNYEEIMTYHLLEDVCVKYAKEFFGEERELFQLGDGKNEDLPLKRYLGISCYIMSLLQKNKKEEAEEYFLKNTLFNPKNK